MNAFELNNVYFSYNQKQVLNGISFNISKGEFFGIIGPNGAGKSTLLRIMGNILRDYKGEVSILGRDIKAIRQKDFAKLVGFVSQETHFMQNYSVEDIVAMGRYPYLEPLQRLKKTDIEAIDWAIEQAGLGELRNRHINSISSGERQLVVICRALCQRPEILLLDEPTSHLDIQHQSRIMELLKNLNKNGITIVIVNHDLNLAAQFCQRLAILNQGMVYSIGVSDAIINKKTIFDVYKTEIEIIRHPKKGVPQILLK